MSPSRCAGTPWRLFRPTPYDAVRFKVWHAVGNDELTLAYDQSDSVLSLSQGLDLVDSFSPAHWASDHEADIDVGSMGPAMVGDHVLAVGKGGWDTCWTPLASRCRLSTHRAADLRCVRRQRGRRVDRVPAVQRRNPSGQHRRRRSDHAAVDGDGAGERAAGHRRRRGMGHRLPPRGAVRTRAGIGCHTWADRMSANSLTSRPRRWPATTPTWAP